MRHRRDAVGGGGRRGAASGRSDTVTRVEPPERVGVVTAAPAASSGAASRRRSDRALPPWALAAAVLLAAVNLRTAVTSVGPVLDELEASIGLSSQLAGVLTTLPVIAFAALGSATPLLARRVGEQRLLTAGLVLMTAGLATRALAGSAWSFLALSVVALVGGAIGNVLIPVMVKRGFPGRVGTMTAGYTTALAVGTTLAAAATVPIAGLRGGRGAAADWRLGLGAWAVLAGVAAVAWLLLPGRAAGSPRSAPGGPGAGGAAPVPSLWRSRTVWAFTAFFAAQSMQAYIAFGWFALFFRERGGYSAAEAGVLVAVLAAMSIPISMVLPTVAVRLPDQRPLVALLLACYVAAYAGMLLAPRGGAWVWVVLAGTGSGAFPLVLTLIGLRTSRPEATASLGAFVQSIGYLVAGSGPLLVGVMHGATGGWTGPFVLLFCAVAVMGVAGWFVAVPGDVEDDLRPAAAGR